MIAVFAGRVRRLRRDARGIAAVEFALCLPFMLALYGGTFILCDAISAYRKTTTTARTITDLTTQYQIVTDSDLDDILAASNKVMTPYSASSLASVVSQVTVDKTGRAAVAWSRGRNRSPRPVASVVTMPDDLKQRSTSLILSEVYYSYAPPILQTSFGPYNMSDKIFMSPRTVRAITKG